MGQREMMPRGVKIGAAGVLSAIGGFFAIIAMAWLFGGCTGDDGSRSRGDVHNTDMTTIQIPGEPDEICDNGVDDDGDGLTDCQDVECQTFSTWCITSPYNMEGHCKNGVDDDGDGLTDCDDPECFNVHPCWGDEEGHPDRCSDNIDNDGDGLTDCRDPDCDGFDSCPLERTICSNHVENPNPQEPGTCCGNGIDDDNDGLADCDDPDCGGMGDCGGPIWCVWDEQCGDAKVPECHIGRCGTDGYCRLWQVPPFTLCDRDGVSNNEHCNGDGYCVLVSP